MIPKTIHYCWFGRGKKPKLALRCIASWKKYCPDYEIIEWNEDNFDVYQNAYTAWCYENKKWAFLSDYARLAIIHDNGGIYFDTDVEVVRPLDELVAHQAFYGFETAEYVNTGEGFGSEANHRVICAMLEEYTALMQNKTGEFATEACPKLNTNALIKLGLTPDGSKQEVAGAMILPMDYFNPYDTTTGVLHSTKHTYSIHWYSMSWLPKSMSFRLAVTRFLRRNFGENCLSFLRK